MAPLAATAAVLMMAGPGMVDTQPGGALTDVPGLALVLSMVALALALDQAESRHVLPQYLLIGLAGGLATGMKFTFLVPVVAIAIALVVGRSDRNKVKALAATALGGTLTGAYWYVRNLVITGNPLPALDLDLGPLSLQAVPGTVQATSLSSVILHGDVWTEHLLPGFRDAYGPGWFVFLALAGLGIVGSIVVGDRAIRLVGLAAGVATVAFVFNPQYLYGGMFFATNLRYAAPGLLLGLVLVPVVVHDRPRLLAAAGLVFGVLLVVTQFDATSWPIDFGGPSFFRPVPRSHGIAAAALMAVAGVVIVGAFSLRRPAAWWYRRIPALAVVAAVVLTIGLAGVRDRYYERQYLALPPVPEAFQWAKGVSDANIGISGVYLAMKYPWAGPDWSNRVQFIAAPVEGGGFNAPANCHEWIDVLTEERFTHVAVMDQPGPPQEARRWTTAQDDAALIQTFRIGGGDALILYLYTLDPAVGERACPDDPGA